MLKMYRAKSLKKVGHCRLVVASTCLSVCWGEDANSKSKDTKMRWTNPKFKESQDISWAGTWVEWHVFKKAGSSDFIMPGHSRNGSRGTLRTARSQKHSTLHVAALSRTGSHLHSFIGMARIRHPILGAATAQIWLVAWMSCGRKC